MGDEIETNSTNVWEQREEEQREERRRVEKGWIAKARIETPFEVGKRVKERQSKTTSKMTKIPTRWKNPIVGETFSTCCSQTATNSSWFFVCFIYLKDARRSDLG